MDNDPLHLLAIVDIVIVDIVIVNNVDVDGDVIVGVGVVLTANKCFLPHFEGNK